MCVVPTLQVLADAFRVNKSVTRVNLSKNEFGDEGLKARAPQWCRSWTDETSVPSCSSCRKFGNSAEFCRADSSIHSAARPWPQPWRSMKPSQRLNSKRTSSCFSGRGDARRSGLGGKFFQSGLVESDIRLCQARVRKT